MKGFPLLLKYIKTIMRLLKISTIILALTAFAFTATNAQAETIILRSGNGSVGGTDSQVNMLVGPTNGPFTSAFTNANFNNAKNGSDAFIINRNGAWGNGLAGDGASKWIATNSGGAGEGSSALYAISFVLSSLVTSATFDLRFMADDLLGTGVNQGVYINGTAISGNSIGGGYTTESTFTRSNIASLLVVGTNTLYLNVNDTGAGPSGLIFRATIVTTNVAEPSMLALLSIGLFGLGRRFRNN